MRSLAASAESLPSGCTLGEKSERGMPDDVLPLACPDAGRLLVAVNERIGEDEQPVG